jgi:hypothetical protein
LVAHVQQQIKAKPRLMLSFFPFSSGVSSLKLFQFVIDASAN